MQVNRTLKDKSFDNIDHALGRPVDPLRVVDRDYYVTDCDKEIRDMRQSSYWEECSSMAAMPAFVVTMEGRKALSEHLDEIGDRNRTYTVTFNGHSSNVVAISSSKAKYVKYLDMSDYVDGMKFIDFASQATARLAS